MKLPFRAFNFYINASIHVGFAVIALVGVTLLEYNLHMPVEVWAFIFLSTISGYNFVKYLEIKRFLYGNLSSTLKSIRIFTLFCIGLMLVFAVELSKATLLILGALALLTFLYAIPLRKRKNLRALGGLKIFIVAIVWACVTVLVPIMASNTPFQWDFWITFLQRICIVLALTIPFEIRDLNQDVSSLRTLPQQLGLKKVKGFGIILLLLVILSEWVKNDFSQSHFICVFAVCSLIAIILVLVEVKQSRYLASFWIESIPICWIILFYILK